MGISDMLMDHLEYFVFMPFQLVIPASIKVFAENCFIRKFIIVVIYTDLYATYYMYLQGLKIHLCVDDIFKYFA